MLLVVGFGVWTGVRATSNAICGSYNFISNDFCDEWNIATPAAHAVPVPASWSIKWQTLDCGSGGCGSRLYVLSHTGSAGGVSAYMRDIQELGWRTVATGDARRGDLDLRVDRADAAIDATLLPRSLARSDYVFVSLAICGEGVTC